MKTKGFKQLLEDTMTLKGWNQRELATALNISEAELCNIIAGRTKISPARALKIADTLGLSQEVFVASVFQDTAVNLGIDKQVRFIGK